MHHCNEGVHAACNHNNILYIGKGVDRMFVGYWSSATNRHLLFGCRYALHGCTA